MEAVALFPSTLSTYPNCNSTTCESLKFHLFSSPIWCQGISWCKYFIYLTTWEIQLHHPCYFGNPTAVWQGDFLQTCQGTASLHFQQGILKGHDLHARKNMDTHLNPYRPYQPKQNKYQNQNNKQLHQVFSAGFLSFKTHDTCALLNISSSHHRKTILGCTFVRQLCGCQSHVFYFQAPFQWGPLTATKAFGLPWMT